MIQSRTKVILNTLHGVYEAGQSGMALYRVEPIQSGPFQHMGMIRVCFDDGEVSWVPEEKLDAHEGNPAESPMWKSHQVANGWSVYPEYCYQSEDGTYVTHWGVRAPFGRGSGSLCAALMEGQYIHEASDEERDIPSKVLTSIQKIADKLGAAGVY